METVSDPFCNNEFCRKSDVRADATVHARHLFSLMSVVLVYLFLAFAPSPLPTLLPPLSLSVSLTSPLSLRSHAYSISTPQHFFFSTFSLRHSPPFCVLFLYCHCQCISMDFCFVCIYLLRFYLLACLNIKFLSIFS